MAAVVFLLVASDQIAKYIVVRGMRLGESIPVWEGVFHITYIENPGAAFGVLAEKQSVFIAAGAVIIVLAFRLFGRISREGALVRYGTSLLFGGAVGNLIDRLRMGRVIDFLDFRVWPVFNIADIGICVGVSCVIYALSRSEEALTKKGETCGKITR